MSPARRSSWSRRAGVTLGMSLFAVALAHPLAGAASDIWGNVGPASPLGGGGLFGRYPLSHYTLDQHFDAVSASLTGGVDVSGVPAMIAYFGASVLWALTSFLANALISLFAFAFSLDLLNGSHATGGAGALEPVSVAIHSIYSNVFGAPWLVLAVAVVGVWAMWKALVQRRYAETAGALGLSLIYVVAALFFVAQPAQTIGAASQWTNQMSQAFLSISGNGSASSGAQARDGDAQQLFDLLVFKPWAVLEFGGLEHCALAGSGSEETDPESVAVRPLSSDPSRDAELAHRLAAGDEVAADGKTCANNANKYASHFLRFGLGTDERDAEYDALDHGDSSRLPEADTERRGYRLGVADKPATDAMEEGGQFQRLLLAIVVFCGELGAFCLLGALSAGVILAQVLLLLLLAFAPVALVAAAIPGRGHDFFKGWLEKLAGYLLRKAAYSLVLAVLLAVNGALASATSQLGWLMSFGLQALFFWAVFLQRRALGESLVGIATGPGAPGREGSLRLLSLYYGARTVSGPLRSVGRSAASALGAPRRLFGAGSRPRDGGGGESRSAAGTPPRFGATYSGPVGGGTPAIESPSPGEPAERPGASGGTGAGHEPRVFSARSADVVTPTAKGAEPLAQVTNPAAAPEALGAGAEGSSVKRAKRKARVAQEASGEDPQRRPRRGTEKKAGQEGAQPHPGAPGQVRPKPAASQEGSLDAERDRSRRAPRSSGSDEAPKPPQGSSPKPSPWKGAGR